MSLKSFQIKMNPVMHQQLKIRANQMGVTIGQMIDNLLSSFELRVQSNLSRIKDKGSDVSMPDADVVMMKLIFQKDQGSLAPEQLEETMLKHMASVSTKDGWKAEITINNPIALKD